jgi:fibronectin type 3 domain-containing protein
MKNKTIYLFILCFLSCASAFAQNTIFAQKKYKYVPMSAPNRITVMLLDYPLHPKTTHPAKYIGYHVYRADAGSSTFKRMTDEPVSAEKDALSMAQKIGSTATNRLMRNLKVKSYDAIFNKVLAGDSSLVFPAMFNLFVAEAFGLCWHDTKVEKGKSYLYYVTKVKADGTESLIAPPPNIEPVTVGVPQKKLERVDYIQGKPANNKIRMEFSKNAEGSLRNIYRSEDSLGTYTQINDLPIMSQDGEQKYDVFLDSLVKPNKNYYYVMSTADLVGNAVYSDTISVTAKSFTIPPVPDISRTESTTEGLRLDWDISNIKSIVGYRLLRRDANVNTPSLLDDKDELYSEVTTTLIAPTDTTYIDNTALSGNQYFYKIISIDKYGTRSPTSVAFSTKYFNPRAPIPPTNVRATPMMKAIKIEWSPNKESDVKGYQVYRAYRNADNRELVSNYLSPMDTVFVDSSGTLSKKISFAYYIKALNQSENESPFSKPVFAAPLEGKVKPMPMNSLTVTHNPFTGNELKWSEAYDLETVGVRIYRKMDANPDTSVWRLIYQEALTKGQYAYIDSLIDFQETYLYKMCALSEDSTESDFSEIRSVGGVLPTIQAPNEVVIDFTEDKVLTISWTPIMANGLHKYAIYRRSYKQGTTKIAEVSVGVHSYKDTVTEKGTYYYRIVPIHKSGKEGNSSEEVSYQIKSF